MQLTLGKTEGLVLTEGTDDGTLVVGAIEIVGCDVVGDSVGGFCFSTNVKQALQASALGIFQ